MTRCVWTAVLLFLSFSVLVPAADAAQDTRVYRSVPGLTVASEEAPVAAVRSFLRARKAGSDEATLASLVTKSEFRLQRQGLTFVRLRQEVDGLEVFGTYVKAAVSDRGEVVHLIENLVVPPAEGVRPARTEARAALDQTLGLLYPGVTLVGELAELESYGNTIAYGGGDFFYRAPTVTRVAVPLAGGALHAGYLVETWTAEDNQLHHTLVAGNGRVLDIQLRTNDDSYNVFPDHPGNSSQTVVSGPGAGNAESPAGWLAGSQTTFNIRGNNVSAYLDTDNNNGPDGGGTAVTTGNFLTAANLSQDPGTNSNKEVAVQNLFYLNNVIHDKLYRHGFIESAGNFQNDNFGNGGSGGDAVNAEAQDGGGTNNANFSTPNDGSPGRMQMYLWTTTNPRRDGDLDSDIVYHEYCHGLTWRMIGNMSGPMSGAIGEGMSDVCALLMNGDDAVGEYATNDPDGVRSAGYTGYTRTYGDFTGSSVHFDGEIYAATLWDLRGRALQAGLSLDTLWDYVVGGMNFTPSGPAMEDMRDGLLQAAAGSGDECLIWETFADHGIGDGAQARTKGGGPFGGGSVTITESFQVPAACNGGSCTPTQTMETSCSDGVDNDCDGLIDAADPDCGTGGCFPLGAACVDNGDCCSNKCKGPSGGKTCK